ncbi:MAG: hypothetical protein AB8G17_20845 [Gammaproteobacteria bacterium]
MAERESSMRSRGFFHEAYGVPLGTVMRFNAARYRELEQRIKDADTERAEQLRVEKDLAEQNARLLHQQVMLKASLATSRDDLAHAKRLRAEAELALEQVDYDGPMSMQPRIPSPLDMVKKAVGLIPVVGTAYTAYQFGQYGVDRFEASGALEIETAAVGSIGEYQRGLQEQSRANAAAVSKAASELEAQQKVTRGLLATSKDLKISLDKL